VHTSPSRPPGGSTLSLSFLPKERLDAKYGDLEEGDRNASYSAHLFDGRSSPCPVDDGWWGQLRPVQPYHWNKFGFGRRQPISFFRLSRRVSLEIQGFCRRAGALHRNSWTRAESSMARRANRGLNFGRELGAKPRISAHKLSGIQ
jgi:hypothetical protein